MRLIVWQPAPRPSAAVGRLLTLGLLVMGPAAGVQGASPPGPVAVESRVAPTTGGPSGPNLLVVSLDTLRADHLGCLGSRAGLTPNLDRFAADAAVFTSAHAQTIQTLHSHASLFTGRYPTEMGHMDRGYRVGGAESPPLIASVLKAYGYRTGAFTGGVHLDPVFGFSVGFDVYEAPRALASLFHTRPLLTRWLDTLAAGPPVFAFLHGYDSHHRYIEPTPFGYSEAATTYRGPATEVALVPDANRGVVDGLFQPGGDYDAPLRAATLAGGWAWDEAARAAAREEARRQHSGTVPLGAEDVEQLRRYYASGVRYADFQFGLLMADFRLRGLLDRFWIVVLSDHGEQLGEDGLFQHWGPLEDYVTHVPLLIRPPGGIPGGRKVGGPVELVDVAPTLLELAGARAPIGVAGRSLLPHVRGDSGAASRTAAFAQGKGRIVSLRGRTGRLSFTGVLAESRWVAGLAAACRLDGPHFLRSAGLSDADAEVLRRELVERTASLSPTPGTDPGPLPDRLRRHLRAAGYWETR